MENKTIDFKQVSIFRNQNLILNEINFELFENEFVFLTGNVGTGKTSFLKSLYAEIQIKSGAAKILDFDLLKITKNEIPFLRRNIGIVFQDFQLLNDRNVYENLKFVLEATDWTDSKKIDNRISEVLKQVEVIDKKNHKPHQLSGGEQQRVVIARALLNNPKIILADEPTGNLDPEASEKIFELFFEISKKGSSVIFATHNHNLINNLQFKNYKIENKNINLI